MRSFSTMMMSVAALAAVPALTAAAHPARSPRSEFRHDFQEIRAEVQALASEADRLATYPLMSISRFAYLDELTAMAEHEQRIGKLVEDGVSIEPELGVGRQTELDWTRQQAALLSARTMLTLEGLQRAGDHVADPVFQAQLRLVEQSVRELHDGLARCAQRSREHARLRTGSPRGSL